MFEHAEIERAHLATEEQRQIVLLKVSDQYIGGRF